MAVRENIGDASASGTVAAVDGTALEPAQVSAMLAEHARLWSLLQDAIAATPASDEDYWVGMGIDEVVVRGESAEAVMAGIESRKMAGDTVVIEFVSSEPQVIVL